MTYEITTTAELTAKYNKEGMYESIVENFDRNTNNNCPTLRDAVEFEVDAYADQYDADNEEFDAAWNKEWAIAEILELVNEELMDDAPRLYTFAVTDNRAGFEHVGDTEVEDYGDCRVVEFNGHTIVLQGGEGEDYIVSIEKK